MHRTAIFACFLVCICLELGLLAQPAELGIAKGTLVMVGGGSMPDDVRKRFVELAGGDKARIVVIPTASGSADKETEPFLQGWRPHKPASLTLLHTRERSQADSLEFAKPLTQATAVWFSGGDQARLTQVYLGTACEKAIREILGRGGVVGGTSAGAAVMTTPMITGGSKEATTGQGFGFLAGCVVDQHFRQRNRAERLQGVLRKHPGFVGIGIDEGTAVIAQGRTLEVMGVGQVAIFVGEKRQDLSAKARFELK